jgi:ribosome-binding protein aMBF1 (putative translation factor)
MKYLPLLLLLLACDSFPIAPDAGAGGTNPACSVADSVSHVCDSCYERGKLEEQTRQAQQETMLLQAQIAGLEAQGEALTRVRNNLPHPHTP